ncbi:MAG: protein phosphatase 2C domain-containing protein [Myxococcales bacterium]|nr:protein phosphatase 2C domain-containing protein [Myxococcales bacterium]
MTLELPDDFDFGGPEAFDQGHEPTGIVEVDLEIDEEHVDDPTGPQPLIRISSSAKTDTGMRRDHNEDAMASIRSEIFVIADGMGGYAAGEVASELATTVLTEAFETESFGGERDGTLPRRADELVRAVKSANRTIWEAAQEDEERQGMGSTLVAARFAPNKKRVYIAHVGDSRCYRLRDSTLEQLTHDHTLEALGITGPARHKLVRALGVEPEVDVDLRIDEPRHGDQFILCSDGLSKMLSDDDIVTVILASASIDDAVEHLVSEANHRGGRDNVSVIIVRVDDLAESMALAATT